MAQGVLYLELADLFSSSIKKSGYNASKKSRSMVRFSNKMEMVIYA
jgi:hypothetical protein